MDAKLTNLLVKIRKNATAAIKGKNLVAAIQAAGWKVEGKLPDVVVTAKNGESFDFGKREDFWFWGWAMKQGVRDAVSEVLGLPSIQAEEDFKEMFGTLKEADLHNAGTCQACFRVQQLNNEGRLVLHGYRRPGDGQTHGRCEGVDQVPLEKDCELTLDILSSTIQTRENVIAHVEELKALKTPITYVETDRRVVDGRWEKVKTTITLDPKKDQYKWETKKGHLVAEAESMLRAVEVHISRLTRVLKTWKPMPSPLERYQEWTRRYGTKK